MSRSIRFSLECVVFGGCFLLAALVNVIPPALAFAVSFSVALMWLLHRRGLMEEVGSHSADQNIPLSPVQPQESFSLSIEPNGHGAFSLYFHANSGNSDSVTLVGQWPTLEQAQKMIGRIQGRGLNVAQATASGLAGERPQAAE